MRCIFWLFIREEKVVSVKTELNEFKKLIKEELMAYEDGEKLFSDWEKGFNLLLKEKRISNKNLKESKGVQYFEVNDEMEIFSIADDFVIAYDDNDLKSYYKTFE